MGLDADRKGLGIMGYYWAVSTSQDVPCGYRGLSIQIIISMEMLIRLPCGYCPERRDGSWAV